MNLEMVKVLVGTETTVMELDNTMMMYGFCSEMDGMSTELIESESIVYTLNDEEYDQQVIVEFDITITASEDDDVSATYVKVTSVDKY